MFINTQNSSTKISRFSPKALAKKLCTVVLVLAFGADASAFSVDGSFNPSFSGAFGFVNGVTTQADGKVLVSGSFNSVNGETRWGLVRLNSDGSLDNTFDASTGPVWASNPSTLVSASFLNILSDGKILFRGQFRLTTSSFTFSKTVRANEDGSLDTTFEASGPTNDVQTSVIAPQTDGKILVGGGLLDSAPMNPLPANIYRLNTDGSVDISFDAGEATSNSGTNNVIAVQADGKVLIGGGFTSFEDTPRTSIAQLNANGSLDTSFNPNLEIDSLDLFVNQIAIQADGKIIVVGNFNQVNGVTRNGIARLNANGSLDAAFDANAGANNSIASIFFQPDDKILIGGYFTSFNGETRNHVALLNANGSLDTAFDPGVGTNNAVLDMSLAADGKLLIGGLFTNVGGQTHNRVARINTASCSGAPAVVAPINSTSSSTPAFSWTGDSACSWYQLYVNDDSGNLVYQTWYTDAQTNCDSDTNCEVTPSTALSSAVNTWWVRGWSDASGASLWSAGKTFAVTTECDTAPTLFAPNGSISNTTPTYTWAGNRACTWYQVWTNEGGNNVYQPWYTAAEANCDGNAHCEATPETPLGSGSHTWWVRGWSNAVGVAPWSSGVTFTQP